MFRAMQGIAVSLCLPTSVAIVANAAPSGRKRNIGFSCLGFVQPIGFSLGMVLEGVILDTVGWRFSYYLCGSLSLAFFFVSLWALPNDAVVVGSVFAKLKREIDWVGALVASSSLGVFSYILAYVLPRSGLFELILIIVKDTDKFCFVYLSPHQYCSPHHKRCPCSSFCLVGSAARTPKPCSLDSQFPLEKHGLHQRLSDRIVLQCSC
jgi:MFS family permease